ncbi:neurofilament heavy polypeptide isoform X1 [Armigeres subalbatus]|uniref:neurofilament heavy polypeptide isoform X1 n=1 Tax=Armigeres subalbatus TaxID=124917 RepID=UPI002ED51127
MSLQVQSSQQPTSGRRTPQIYQSLGSTTTATTPPTNGNTAKGSSKLSLKSGKQSPVVEISTRESPVPKESTKSPNVVVAVTKLENTPTGGSSSSPKAAEKPKDEKKEKAATNGNSNGTHSEKETNGKHVEPEKVTTETPKKESTEKVSQDNTQKSPNSTPQKQKPESIPVEQPRTPESASKKSKDSPVVTPEQTKKVANPQANEKKTKGFTAEGDEMESLVVEPSEYEDSPMPPRTGGKTKLLKYSGVPPTRARISPFRVKDATINASTVANLSTVSEGQDSATKSKDVSLDSEQSSALGMRPLRAISGRRGMRPISDIQFTYRKSTELNESASSLNVTVGSEIHNDSLRTPAPGSSRKRKAMTPESTSDALDVKESTDSPKRTRLDFSGFLGIVASPVTMLKNRLSRVRLQASTPVAKRNFDEEDLTTCIQAEATTTTANISGEAAKMDVDPAAGADDKVEEVQKSEEAAEEQPTELLNKEDEAAKDVDGAGDVSESPVEVKDVTNKRQFCVVM